MKGVDYPHPLLHIGGDDYINCSFDITVDEEQTGIKDSNIVISTSYLLDCNGLNEMITAGTAKVIIIIQSVALSYRRVFYFEERSLRGKFTVPKDCVSDKLEIIGYIIAAKSIKSFSLLEHNPDYYRGVTFSIRKGDILARSTQKDIPIDDSELDKPISSIFDIAEKSDMDMMIYPEFEDDKIRINIIPEMYNTYYQLREYNNGAYRRALAGLVVLPVLTEAIDKMIGNIQCDEASKDMRMFDWRWYRAINKKLRELNIDLENYSDPSISLASKLLGDVVHDALLTFKLVIDDETSGEEKIRIGRDD